MSARAQFASLRVSPLNANAANDLGHDTGVQFATDDLGGWIAVWSSSENLNGNTGTDQDILFARSLDDGRTWSAPRALHSNAATDAEADQQPRVATDRGGRWVVVWHSRENTIGNIGDDGDIVYSVSDDLGGTWSAPRPLNSNANTDGLADVQPDIQSDGKGTWVVAWHAMNPTGSGSDMDIFFSRSLDGAATWSAAAPLHRSALTDEGNDSQVSLATDTKGRWVAAWSSTDDLAGVQDGDSDVLVSFSSDNGESWSAPAFARSDALTDKLEDFNIQVQTDARGAWLLVWESGDDLGGTIGTDQDILVVRSTDGGVSWSAPVAVNATAATDRGLDSFPSLSTDGSGAWVCVWNSGDESTDGRWGKDSDILAAYSLDEGRTWSAPNVVASNAPQDTARDTTPRVLASHSGRWLVAWQTSDAAASTFGADEDLLFARIVSPLFWSEARAINTDQAGDQRVDAFLRTGSDEAGTLVAVWNGTQGGVSDMLFARSTNNGVSWSAPALFRTNATAVGGRDPRVITDKNGTWIVVWGKDGDILATRSTDNGITWSMPNSVSPGDAGDSDFSPFLATDGAGNWVLVWGTQRASLGGDFDVMSASSVDNGATWSAPQPLKRNAANDSGDDFDPQVAADGDGRWIAVWMSNDTLNNTIGTDDDLFWAYSLNNGGLWSDAAPFNPNAATDSADDDDYTPQIATDRHGTWIVAWHSESTLGQTIGTDMDIVFMRSVDHGVTWSQPAALNSNAASDIGADRYLELAVGPNGSWLAAWQSDEPSLGGQPPVGGAPDEFDIILSRSSDGGANWSPPAALNPNASTDSVSEITPGLILGAGGKLLASQIVTSAATGGEADPAAYVAFQPAALLPVISSNSSRQNGFRITSAALNGSNLEITWTGGSAPYAVQASAALPAASSSTPAPFVNLHALSSGSGGPWQTVLVTCSQNATLPISGSRLFFRVVSIPDTGGQLDWAGDTLFTYPTGADAVANTLYVDGFGINADVHELVSGALPLVVTKPVVNTGRLSVAPGFTATIEVRGMSFLAVGGQAGYVPGSDAQVAFACTTTATPGLDPGQSGSVAFTLGGPACAPSLPLAALPCGMYQVTITASVPASGTCSSAGGFATISSIDYIFVSTTNRLNMQVTLNPTGLPAPDGPAYPNVVTCVQNRVGVWTDPGAAIGGFETAPTHQVNITTFPNPAATYFVRARNPVFGNKGIGTQANLAPAISQSPAPPSQFTGAQAFTWTVTAPQGYHGRRGCNGSCGLPLVFWDKLDVAITAIATDGCSIVSRTLRAAAIYECDALKFEFP